MKTCSKTSSIRSFKYFTLHGELKGLSQKDFRANK